MPCYFPLRGYRSTFPAPNGKFRITGIKRRTAQEAAPPGVVAVDLPCGQCHGCRLERSRKWAVRCMNEASLHSDNCFITLTYDPERLPKYGSLVKSDFQKFMKRLRKEYGHGIRFFHCGEYGDMFGRPHYHACIFNHDFKDRVLFKVVNDTPCYTSVSLSRLWPSGFSTVGNLTFESAAYVARYCMKKVTGKKAFAHYSVLDTETGEIIQRSPEYVTMSRRPGIGHAWYKRFFSDVYPSDFMISRGVKMKPPRYYDGLYELSDGEGMQALRDKRLAAMDKARADNTLDRLKVREQVAQAKVKLLKRSLDDAS